MTKPLYLQQYVDYIRNAGGTVTVDQFDYDWEPVGVMLRSDLVTAGMIVVSNDEITVKP